VPHGGVPPRTGRGGALSPNDGVPFAGVARDAGAGVGGPNEGLVPLGGVGGPADGVPLGGVNGGFERPPDGGPTDGVPLGGVNGGFERPADDGRTGVPFGGVSAGLGRTADGGATRGVPRGGVPFDGGRGGEGRLGGTGPWPRPDELASASIWASISARRSAASERGRRGSSGGVGLIETHHRAGGLARRPRHRAG
jgi:hypothetical protein